MKTPSGIEKTAAGHWRARWRDSNGTQKAKTFKFQRDAIAYRETVLTDIRSGTHVSPDRGKLTVATWADQWLDGARHLGPGGLQTYRRDLDAYIIPALGDLRLNQITDEHIDAYITEHLEYLAPSTVHRHYRTVHTMLSVAVDRHRIPFNPCAPVKPPTIEDAEMRFLTPAEIDAVAGAMVTFVNGSGKESTGPGRYRAWVYVAATGGLRWSELVGLRRSAIDGDIVKVTEQFIKRDDGLWHREPPKAKSRRNVVLPAFAAAELAEHLERWTDADADALVFPNQRGGPIGTSFRANVWKPALRRAGVDDLTRPHDLRHTAVALAIAAGAHPKAIQARMGHRSITVTLDRYGHLFPDIDEKVAAGIDALWVPGSSDGA